MTFGVLLRGAAALTFGLSVSACGGDEPAQPMAQLKIYKGKSVRVFKDPKSGCEYLLLLGDERSALEPRLNSNGKPDCPALQPSVVEVGATSEVSAGVLSRTENGN